MATTRTSMVLLVPRVVGAEMVSASPTLTPSFSAWLSKIRIVPGCARSSSLPLTDRSTDANSGSLVMSMPVMPSCIDAGVGDDLGPAAPAVDRERHLGDGLLGDRQHLLVVGHDRRRLTGRHLEEPAHVHVAGRQRRGGVDHGLAHAGRETVQQHQQRGHGGDGGAQEDGVRRRCCTRLRNAIVRSTPELGHGYSSSCIAWRGLTRIASQAG